MADWRRVVGVLVACVMLVACSSGGDEAEDVPDAQPLNPVGDGLADPTEDSPLPADTDQDDGPAVSITTVPATVVTPEQVAESRSGYDPDDAALGQPIEVIDPDGAIVRAEAFIPDQFPEDRAVIDRLIEAETAIATNFLDYDVVLLYEPLPHCGTLPSLQATTQDGTLVLSVVLDKTGECTDLAFTAAVGIDVAEGFNDLPIIASAN